MYAIIDIETTGGSPKTSKIIEIAIVIHDGKDVIKSFSTLINPNCRIPYSITQLTNITDEMVMNAPAFHEIARKIIELTEEKIFVAHNVRFDYGFIKAAYKDLGYDFNRKTLCTVQLSRKTFKGLPSYSLGNLCKSLDIQVKNRHRALGDAEATAILFTKIIEQNSNSLTPNWLSIDFKKTTLPPLVNESSVERIPFGITGVYYFYNQLGNVIYVGKSKDIKKRILQHFINQKSKKSIRLLHEIADISYENTGSELIALLLESDEIKKLRPPYNTSQKRVSIIPSYGIFQRKDFAGYMNLSIERLKAGSEPLTTMDNLMAAKEILYKAVDAYELCLSKCDLHNTGGPCFNHQIHKCLGACINKEDTEIYNARVSEAIVSFSFNHESFFLLDKGRNDNEKSVICIEKGIYKGFGYFDFTFSQPTLDDLRDSIKKYSHNRDIQSIISRFLTTGMKKISITENIDF